jgi:hypothetical protein
MPSRAGAQVEGDRDLSWLAVGEIVPSPLLWNGNCIVGVEGFEPTRLRRHQLENVRRQFLSLRQRQVSNILRQWSDGVELQKWRAFLEGISGLTSWFIVTAFSVRSLFSKALDCVESVRS